MKKISYWAFVQDTVKESSSLCIEAAADFLKWTLGAVVCLSKVIGMIIGVLVAIVAAGAVLLWGVFLPTITAGEFYSDYISYFGIWLVCFFTSFLMYKVVKMRIRTPFKIGAFAVLTYTANLIWYMPAFTLYDFLSQYSIWVMIGITLVASGVFAAILITIGIGVEKCKELKKVTNDGKVETNS
jgi:hypothetical protein